MSQRVCVDCGEPLEEIEGSYYPEYQCTNEECDNFRTQKGVKVGE